MRSGTCLLGRIIHAGNGDRRFSNNAHGDNDEVGTSCGTP